MNTPSGSTNGNEKTVSRLFNPKNIERNERNTMSTNNSKEKTMYENQNTQTEIVDPYASINASEGAPFIIRRNYYADVLSVFFNQSWNAAFVIERNVAWPVFE